MAAARRSGARHVQIRDFMDPLADDDMTEREDDEQTDHSSSGMAADSPRNLPANRPGAPSTAALLLVAPARSHSPPSSSPLDSAGVSAEDEDYRSETSSETNSKEYGAQAGALTQAKPAASSYTNHRDLTSRLKRAIGSSGCGNGGGGGTASSPCFDESMIGADVVLCARVNSERVDAAEDAAEDGAEEIKKFYTHRFMLAASSEPFRAMLTGGMREAAQREVQILGVDARILEKMLVYIYTGEVTVDLHNVVGLLIGSEMYELAGLREICKGFVLIHAQDIFRDPLMVQIPEKVLVEIVEQDDLQIKEIALMEALVMWGEARVASSEKPILDVLSDVMEHVRFPTMSVSDLYGKVRPLVEDGVIRESLLTEALFYHLKWGIHTSKASHRMRPRAGAAALRKRKRVSFIQHVSFVNE